MKNLKRALAVVLALAMVLSLAACGGSSTTTTTTTTEEKTEETTEETTESEYNGPAVVIKCGLGASSTGHSGIALANLEKRIEARTGGLVDFQCYPDSQLGTETEIANGVAIGTIEMSMPGMGTFANIYPQLAFANTPYLLGSREQSYAFYDGEFMQNLNKDIEENTGIKVLCYGENGCRGLSNNVRSVETPEDLKGLKIRVQENPLHIKMMELLGATATPIAFAELYTALNQKTVDGQDNGIPLTVNNKFYEVNKYYTTTSHCIDQLALIANSAWWDSLDPSLQNILLEEAENWKWDIRQLAVDFDKSGIETMESAGCEVVQLDDEGRKAFQDLMGPAWDLAAELVGEDFFKEVEAALETAQAEADAHPSSIVY